MTNIVMITRDRPRLTSQALVSISQNTPRESYTLTVVDDGSTDPWYNDESAPILSLATDRAWLRLLPGLHILGGLRNAGAWYSEKLFGRGDYLCFLDNDICVTRKGWLERMWGMIRYRPECKVLGGIRHPFHAVNSKSLGIYEFCAEYTDAVAGYSMMMSWETYDRFGPFVENAQGTGQSEDYALCRKVVDAGYKVGYIHPHVLLHCGITNSDGKPATGADQFIREDG